MLSSAFGTLDIYVTLYMLSNFSNRSCFPRRSVDGSLSFAFQAGSSGWGDGANQQKGSCGTLIGARTVTLFELCERDAESELAAARSSLQRFWKAVTPRSETSIKLERERERES